jgi:DNA polymerase IV
MGAQAGAWAPGVREAEGNRAGHAVQSFLDPMPLSALRGVGVKTAPRLLAVGSKMVGDIRHLPLTMLRRELGTQAGTHVYQQSRGVADDRVYPLAERKSISKETTFAQDVTDPQVLRSTLRWAAQEVGYLARQEGRAGTNVTLEIRFHPFDTPTRFRALPAPSAADGLLLRAA